MRKIMMLFDAKRVVFFCAHTDDEMICAGTLNRFVRAGAEVTVLAFAQAAGQDDRRGESFSEQVDAEFLRSMEIIGAKGMCLCERPSSRLHERGQMIADCMFNWCEDRKPDVVITLSPDDENPAHSVVGRQAERVTRGRVPVHLRCQFPWNYSIGRANLFVTLDDEAVAIKRSVIAAYQSQAFRYDYREMLMSYCRADGLSVKAEWAEKFELIRGVL